MTNFCTWLNTLITEKGIDLERNIEVEGPSGLNIMPLSMVIDAIKFTTAAEQAKIKTTLVQIDFANGDICHFFQHLAGALAR